MDLMNFISVEFHVFFFNFTFFANISARFIRYMDIESFLSSILLGFPSLRFLFVALFVYTVMFVHVSFPQLALSTQFRFRCWRFQRTCVHGIIARRFE